VNYEFFYQEQNIFVPENIIETKN